MQTKDMILDPAKLEMINTEMDSTFRNKKERNYQKDKSFKYEYVQYLNPRHELKIK